jgi:hypothetical protein
MGPDRNLLPALKVRNPERKRRNRGPTGITGKTDEISYYTWCHGAPAALPIV